MNESNHFSIQNNNYYNNNFSFKLDFWTVLLIISVLAVYYYNQKPETKQS